MRTAGIILPLFSLPTSQGIGSMGRPAHEFIDFLEEAGQHQWLMLPIGPTSYKDSPYQSFSAFAGNPYFIDIGEYEDNDIHIDYNWLFQNRIGKLQQQYQEWIPQDDFYRFQQENIDWLKDYALFMALKVQFNYSPWYKWPVPFRTHNQEALNGYEKTNPEPIRFFEFIQYLFFTQWQDLRKKATQKQIQLIGDIPIYVAYDSVDVWCNPTLFMLDENLVPTKVAGVPPDYFSKTGQLWGNPLYNWDTMKQNNYQWWVNRIAHQLKYFDQIRIDHFRGFDSFYAIESKYKTAKKGNWLPGPGIDLFRVLEEKLGKLPIIAEDLGFITPSVQKLLEQTAYPGMRVLQFAFDEEESVHFPFHYPANCVAFTGTHDNPPLQAWIAALTSRQKKQIKEKPSVFALITSVLHSKANLVLIPLQDYLELGKKARINQPGTDENNWSWRLKESQLSDELAFRIKKATKEANR